MKNAKLLLEKFADLWLKWQKRQIAYLLYDLEEYEQELISQAVRGVRLRPPGRTVMYLTLSGTQRQILHENRGLAQEIYERVRCEYPQSGITFPDVTKGANPFLAQQEGENKLKNAKLLLERLTELYPPSGETHHNLVVDNGNLVVTVVHGNRFYPFTFTDEEEDFEAPVEELVRQIQELMAPVLFPASTLVGLKDEG